MDGANAKLAAIMVELMSLREEMRAEASSRAAAEAASLAELRSLRSELAAARDDAAFAHEEVKQLVQELQEQVHAQQQQQSQPPQPPPPHQQQQVAGAGAGAAGVDSGADHLPALRADALSFSYGASLHDGRADAGASAWGGNDGVGSSAEDGTDGSVEEAYAYETQAAEPNVYAYANEGVDVGSESLGEAGEFEEFSSGAGARPMPAPRSATAKTSSGRSAKIVAKTALHTAASSRRLADKVAQALIDAPRDIFAVDSTNRTPLHCAAYGGSVAAIALLLEAEGGATVVNWPSKYGTPLMCALRSPVDSFAGPCAARLIMAGADTSATDPETGEAAAEIIKRRRLTAALGAMTRLGAAGGGQGRS